MASTTTADDYFENHKWKSEFASTRSGRNSPNFFAKVRRKLLLTPPVRNARSPKLTDEELDALTGNLPYATNYTYAYSKIYDPSLPDHWEVPNLTDGLTYGNLAEQEHWSAASLSRQLFYILRLPVYLILHVITYILEAFYHVIKISSYTFLDYLLYLLKLAKSKYHSYLDNRRRTAIIRNRQDPLKVKLAQTARYIVETIAYVVLTPYRMFSKKNAGIEQYQYRSIKNQLENERASRMTTRSQALERSRMLSGLSKSPARNSTPTVAKTSTITKITARVFKNSPFEGESSESYSSTIVTGKNVKERSVTPRFRQTRASAVRGSHGINRAFDSPDVDVDTPRSTYSLRNRQSHLNTPEPSFNIGNAAATSTPLSSQDVLNYTNVGKDESKLKTVVTWFGYLILFPFFAAIHVWYSIYDYGKSTYMKLTNYQPTPMETIHLRDAGEPAPSDTEVVLVAPWTTKVAHFFRLFFEYVKEAHLTVFAITYGAIHETVSYLRSLFGGFTNKNSSRFSWCQVFGFFLALVLALFLFGFLTSDNTAIRKEIPKKNIAHGTSVDSVPTTPVWVAAGNNVKHYIWMAKEYVYDLAFNSYSYLTPIVGRVTIIPNYSSDLVSGGVDKIFKAIGLFFTTINNYAVKCYQFLANGASSVYKSIGGFFYSLYENLSNKLISIAGWTRAFFYNTMSKSYDFFDYIVAGFRNVFTVSLDNLSSFFQSTSNKLYDYFSNYVYVPIKGLFSHLTGSYDKILQSIWDGFRLIYNLAVFLVNKTVSMAISLVTYPVQQITRAWVHISQYAPEDAIQVFPIPQAITPTPVEERDAKKQEETLRRRIEVDEEQLVITPAPVPKAIPIPDPVIIHQTNVVETVDKEAIIKEVTDKLRAELSVHFEQELSAKIKHYYNTIIENPKVENTNVQYDRHYLEAIIRQLIYEYDTDKTGQVDYALESSGGAVVSTRCSETYKSYTRLEKFWDIPIYYLHYTPRIVIQRNSKTLFPGECWCFKEGRGYIAVELSHFIDVSSISYEHIGKEVAPDGNRQSAPKNVLIWAYKQIDDLNSRVLIGDYMYDLDGPPLQFFIAKHKPDFPVKFVELEVTSNYGASFTCLYRLRVHGKVVHVN